LISGIADPEMKAGNIAISGIADPEMGAGNIATKDSKASNKN
jgi:hypothetical protein